MADREDLWVPGCLSALCLCCRTLIPIWSLPGFGQITSIVYELASPCSEDESFVYSSQITGVVG